MSLFSHETQPCGGVTPTEHVDWKKLAAGSQPLGEQELLVAVLSMKPVQCHENQGKQRGEGKGFPSGSYTDMAVGHATPGSTSLAL